MTAKSTAIRMGTAVIGNAIVWGAVILACSAALKGTGGYDLIQNYLAVGPTITTMIILVSHVPFKKKDEQKEVNDTGTS
ncbi:hypothetical protein GF324_00975 [bacterium]|nr:hypothetical protein [bacterium]